MRRCRPGRTAAVLSALIVLLVSVGSAFQSQQHAATPWRGRRRLGATVASSDALTVETSIGSAEISPQQQSSSSSRWDSVGGDEVGRTTKTISTLLVCGDGDLSYSAAIAPELAASGVRLTATVLEDCETHRATYRNSRRHTETILSSYPDGRGASGAEAAEDAPFHEVVFGVDATDLDSAFPNDEKNRTFDRIQFNFPHWRGKANHRHNRALLSNFLQSAAGALTPGAGENNGGVGRGGEIHVALCQGQGGATASTIEEWRGSWKAAEFANEAGLVLLDVSPYTTDGVYDRSSHRGVDRPFGVGEVPKMYVFGKPGGEDGGGKTAVTALQEFQMCCKHELHVNLPDATTDDSGDDDEDEARYSLDDIINGDAVRTVIESVVPDGVRVEVPLRRVLTPEETGSSCRVGVYLIVYAGEGRALTRSDADEYRARTEREVALHVPLRANRAGRMVSRPLPYPLVKGLDYRFFTQGKEGAGTEA